MLYRGAGHLPVYAYTCVHTYTCPLMASVASNRLMRIVVYQMVSRVYTEIRLWLWSRVHGVL